MASAVIITEAQIQQKEKKAQKGKKVALKKKAQYGKDTARNRKKRQKKRVSRPAEPTLKSGIGYDTTVSFHVLNGYGDENRQPGQNIKSAVSFATPVQCLPPVAQLSITIYRNS